MKGYALISYLYLTIAASLWGIMYVAGKYVMGYISPFLTLWLRYLIAFVVLFIISFIYKKERLRKEDILFLFILSLTGHFISLGAAFIGTFFTTAQLGALIATTPPIFTVILASLILKEKITYRKLISITLAMLGIIISLDVNFEGGNLKTFIPGVLLLLTGAIAWGVYTILLRKAQYSITYLTTYTTGISFILFTPIMLFTFNVEELPQLVNGSVIYSLIYLGIFATAVAFFLWNKGIERVEASTGSIFTFFNAIAGGFFGWLLLKEPLTWNYYIGCLLVFVAIVIVLYREPEQISPEERMPV